MQLGYIVARVYSSYAEIPIKDAVLTVYKSNGDKRELLGVRLSDENGKTIPIPVDAPDEAFSTSPGYETPYASVNLRIDHPDYNTYYVEGVQVFPGNVSVQNAEMMPTGDHISYDNKADLYHIESNNIL